MLVGIRQLNTTWQAARGLTDPASIGSIAARNASLLDHPSQMPMNSKTRDFVISNGRRIIMQIQKLMGRYSLIGDRQFFAPENFPWSREIEGNWKAIRAEPIK